MSFGPHHACPWALNRLQDTAVRIPALAGKSQTGGLLNVNNAIQVRALLTWSGSARHALGSHAHGHLQQTDIQFCIQFSCIQFCQSLSLKHLGLKLRARALL